MWRTPKFGRARAGGCARSTFSNLETRWKFWARARSALERAQQMNDQQKLQKSIGNESDFSKLKKIYIPDRSKLKDAKASVTMEGSSILGFKREFTKARRHAKRQKLQ